MTQTEVRERPILFSTPMVRAILEGRKTQTRRIVKPQPDKHWAFNLRTVENLKTQRIEFVDDDYRYCVPCPYGRPSDRLWVREAWAPASAALPSGLGVLYRSDYHTELEKRDGDQKWKPSIHMPRWASRITLEITRICVERVQEISEKDAIAEGCIKLPASGRITDVKGGQYGGRIWTTAKGWYSCLWNSINGPESWSENPWVWVVEFKRF